MTPSLFCVCVALGLALTPAAAETRCWKPATGGLACSDGTRIHEFRGNVTLERNGVVVRRCARTATGELRCADKK